ncbi:MerR family transcriptional regulator [Clostridium sporogenes]|uniref:MerR family transcriptional regulator n=1 Tax=Clostridium botulinum TaxID=1491 RepID=A0A6M0SWZ0_CLOBO|nr:MerR family transcriptional regulator [Clostridium sporogenes]NFA59190.1 MerR family transcriptional regulator [Clostridium botulinum]NFI74797.1 MerR family transcriptional regulator [Clostridium sporogenes]NFL71070.1 MerR family transcriptional regulator [Clostridium sporogenes]NFM24924.1 MerR family transcriptional regulator [Clostridium sporogenes]NFN85808.1 MerR family transcriptional regulator [Clostridium sporogenes]
MYTIGQLALILKVSTRTLRHYDDISLLKPYSINKQNGYRYYEQEQLGLAKNIIKLKEYGLSLEEIKEIIANSDINNYEIIKKRLNIIENEISKLTEMRNNLCNILKENKVIKRDEFNYKIHEVEAVKLDDINVISKKCTINIKDIGKVVGSLYELINKNGLRIKGSHIVKYFEKEYDPENAEVEICIPIESRKEGKLKVHIIPKGRYVTTTANSMSEKGDAYESIINWIQVNNYKINGNPFEEYNVNYKSGLFNINIYYPIQ